MASLTFGACSANEQIDEVVVLSQNIKDFAAAFASVVLAEPELARSVNIKAYEMFDGDYDVLYSTAADIPLPAGSALRSRGASTLGQAVSAASGGPLSRAAVEREDLNIYLYGPEGSTADQVPGLVAFYDYRFDEKQTEVIFAYSAEGELIALDAKNPPTIPVYVIGLNERMDPAYSSQNLEPESKAIIKDGTYIRLSSFYMGKDLLEPWYRGNPEVIMVVNDVGADGNVYNVSSRVVPGVNRT